MAYSTDHILHLFKKLHEAWHSLQHAVSVLPSSDTQYRLTSHAKEGTRAAIEQEPQAMRIAFGWIEVILSKGHVSDAVHDAADALQQLLDELMGCVKHSRQYEDAY